MIDLVALYYSIPESKEELKEFLFEAIPIPNFGTHKLCRNSIGKASLLLHSSKDFDSYNYANIKLKNITILFNTHCRVIQNNKTIEDYYTIISFTGANSELQEYFLKLCSLLLYFITEQPTTHKIQNEIQKFVDLFKILNEPPIKSIQGLFAELLLINESTNPKQLINFWHSFPTEKFDFCYENERIEVKSTSFDNRIHTFSNEQLNQPETIKVYVVSIILKNQTNGINIQTLTEKIIAKLNNDLPTIDRLNTIIFKSLGNSIEDSLKIQFDYNYAINSIAFYNSADIPKIELSSIPKSVFDVKYKSDLTNSKTINFSNEFGDSKLLKYKKKS